MAVTRTEVTKYPDTSPFHPQERFPEYTGDDVDPRNQVYAKVRETLARLGLDEEHFGTPEWNPFGGIIEPGMTVLLKPNTVSHRNEGGHSLQAVITHAAVVRPVLDYIAISLRGQGRIVIADSPYLFCQYDEALKRSGIADLVEWHQQTSDVPIECLDLRLERATETRLFREWQRIPIKQDRGYRWIDLRAESHFHGIDPDSLRIGVAPPAEMRAHHSEGKHEYLFPQTVLDADAIIHVPKLKTHRRAAMSLGIKSFIGFPSAKGCLPHYRLGSPEEGGDQYPQKCWRKRLYNRFHDAVHGRWPTPVKIGFALMKRAVLASGKVVPFRDDVLEAMWHGNDTIWRTLNDLVRIGYYADREGHLQEQPQRRHFFLADGIVGGQNNGPVAPTPITSGLLLAARNPVALDATAATLMGFNLDRIPQIARPLQERRSLRPLIHMSQEQIRAVIGDDVVDLASLRGHDWLPFEPHGNWVGHLEQPSSALPCSAEDRSETNGQTGPV